VSHTPRPQKNQKKKQSRGSKPVPRGPPVIDHGTRKTEERKFSPPQTKKEIRSKKKRLKTKNRGYGGGDVK